MKLLVFTILVCPIFLWSQTKNQKQEVDQLLEKSFAYNQSNVDSAILLSKNAIQLANEYGYNYGINDGYTKLAIAYRFKGIYDSSIYYSQKALDLTDDKLTKASNYNNLGVSYRYLYKYDEALEQYLKAADVYQSNKDWKQLGIVYNNIGTMFIFSEFNQKAKKYLDKALEIHKAHKHQKALADVYNNYGIYYANESDLNTSLIYFQQSMKIEKELNNLRGINDSYFNIAAVYTMMGNIDSAKFMILNSIALDKEMGNVQGVISDYNALAETLIEFGNHQEAYAYLDTAIQYARSSGSMFELALAYEQMAHVYSQQGDYKNAYLSYVQFKQVEDSAINNNKNEIIAELEAQYETKEQKRALELKDLKIENQNAQIYQSQLQIIVLSISVLALIVIAVLIYFYLKAQKQKQVKAAIIEEQRKGLESIIQATEEERKRIAKDLHDGLGQQLSGLKMAVRNLQDNSAIEDKEALQKITSIIDESATEARNMSHQMMPKVLIESGLIDAIDDMLQKSLGFAQIKYSFEHYDHNERISETAEIALFRIIQELINNVLKHSGATEVDVQILKTGKNIIMVVEDNGVGISTTENTGLGMMNIKSRISQMEGIFSIEKGMDSGTVATVKLPL